MKFRCALLLLLAWPALGCLDDAPPVRSDATSGYASATPSMADATTASSVGEATDAADVAQPTPPALSPAAFRKLVKDLSEPDAAFFSDNFISNETSYLQPAAALQRAASPGGVYLGVGPEQNFTYIALTRPARAYIVDIRRDNLVLHLLYKVIFEQARSRSEFLTLLTGRPYDADVPVAADAAIEQVITHAERLPADEKSFQQIHERLRDLIEQDHGFDLSKRDRRSLRDAHRAFFRDGLDIRFKLKEKSYRKYPPLREILAARDPAEDERLGFLATESAFRTVQKLQRNNLVIPVVGNFGGDHALPALAKHLKREELRVATFYVSNVEQYLLQDGLWWKWTRNIEALPLADQAFFIRCYLDQGRAHPQQMKGHRTTTVLQRIADFKARNQDKPYRSMYKLSVDTWSSTQTDATAATSAAPAATPR